MCRDVPASSKRGVRATRNCRAEKFATKTRRCFCTCMCRPTWNAHLYLSRTVAEGAERSLIQMVSYFGTSFHTYSPVSGTAFANTSKNKYVRVLVSVYLYCIFSPHIFALIKHILSPFLFSHLTHVLRRLRIAQSRMKDWFLRYITFQHYHHDLLLSVVVSQPGQVCR